MEEKNLYEEISSIKEMMERSSKFISLSGISGVLAGIYALTGSYIAYSLIYTNYTLGYENDDLSKKGIILKIAFIAITVLILAIGSGVYLTIRKCQKNHLSYWNPVSKRLLSSMLFPLATGGIIVIAFIFKGYFSFIPAFCLIFYGLALAAASQYTYNDVRWLGLTEISLGLIALVFPEYGLGCWAMGFGFLHLVYGTIMHFKYDR